MTDQTNLGRFIIECTRRFGTRPAFILKDEKSRRPVSYNEFGEMVLRISQAFRERFPQGDFKVGLWGENRVEWCALALGIWHAGGTLVPLMPIATEQEVAAIISASRLEMLFVSPSLQQNISHISEVYGMDFRRAPAGSHRKNLGDLLASGKPIPSTFYRETQTHPDDTAILIFTSGTTGKPKGVMLSHRNIITNILDIVDVIPGKETDRAVSVLPLAHMFELVGGFLIAHLKGICITYPASLKSEDILNEMRTHRATLLVAVPLLFEILDRSIQEKINQLPKLVQKVFSYAGGWVQKFPGLGPLVFRPVHSVFGGKMRTFVTGGARIDPEIIKRFEKLGIRMLQGYGLTETSPVISFTSLQDGKPASVGKTVPSLKIKIESPSSDQEGEICVKGPSVFRGYFENEEATAQVIRDGWFYTGDLGRMDSDGYLYITGRKKDMIVTPNGKNVYPEELEEILRLSPYFQEVAVLGIEKGRGETIHAVIVPSGAGVTEEKIWHEINRLSTDLSDYKKIQGITIWKGELPKTATKKVKKFLLKERILSGANESAGTRVGQSGTPLSPKDMYEGWLKEKLSVITKQPEIWKEAHLRQDMGLDSLTFMEVISGGETHWNVKIPDERFEHILTVQDLLQAFQESDSRPSLAPAEAKSFDYRANNSWWMNSLRLTLHAFVIRPILKIFFKLKVVDRVEVSENFILTPNHSSHLDVLTILSGLPLKNLNHTYSVAADDYFFNHPLKAFLVRLLFNAVPFERKARVDKGFRICEEILSGGGSLVIFPEGTRSLTGDLAPFKVGVGRLLAAKSYPAVPAYIAGAHRAFPKGAVLPRRAPLSVIFGAPQNFPQVSDDIKGYQTIAENLQRSVEHLRDAISPS